MKKPSHSKHSPLSRREFIAGSAAGIAAIGVCPPLLASMAESLASEGNIHTERHCRFTRLMMQDYGVFRGFNELSFTPGLNVIHGDNGSGKTTILKSLAILGPDPRIAAHHGVPSPSMSVEVETEGNPELLDRYRDLIFLDENFYDQTAEKLPAWLRAFGPDRLEEEAKRIYVEWIPYMESPLRRYTLREVVWKGFPAGERLLASLSYVFAVRNRLGLDLPLVMERPWNSCDHRYESRLAYYVSQMKDQVILLLLDDIYISTFTDYSTPTHWLLPYPDHSRIGRPFFSEW
jgi:energy-coupling factor transporter ATP-binding protein EcfA2